jgi:hypothetical protein
MNPLPPVNNTKRKNYTHRQRSIDLPSKLRAQNYFKNSVTPTLNTFLQSVSAQQPEDVLAFMFAWSRRELSERKLRVGRPEVEAYFVDEQQQPQQEEEDEEDDSEAQSYAAAKIQARHRGRQQRSRVKKIKQQNAAEIRGATVIQANQRGRKSRRANNPKKSSTPTTNNQTELLAVEEAPPQQSKAGKMGGLLMKAKKDGSLEARVEKMETELGDDA